MKQQTFEEFARDKLDLLRMTSFYGGQPLTDAETVRVQTIENLLKEYNEKIERGWLCVNTARCLETAHNQNPGGYKEKGNAYY